MALRSDSGKAVTAARIADSPVGLAAYFLDHDARSYKRIAHLFSLAVVLSF
jgi:hypothetical protein